MKKKKSEKLHLLYLLGIFGFLSVVGLKGCNDSLNKTQNTPKIDSNITENESMSLTDKERLDSSSVLYFDTDGNTNTTEIVAKAKFSCCPSQDAQIHDAQIGKKQSFKDWKKELFCEKCGKKQFWIFQKVR